MLKPCKKGIIAQSGDKKANGDLVLAFVLVAFYKIATHEMSGKMGFMAFGFNDFLVFKVSLMPCKALKIKCKALFFVVKSLVLSEKKIFECKSAKILKNL